MQLNSISRMRVCPVLKLLMLKGKHVPTACVPWTGMSGRHASHCGYLHSYSHIHGQSG